MITRVDLFILFVCSSLSRTAKRDKRAGKMESSTSMHGFGRTLRSPPLFPNRMTAQTTSQQQPVYQAQIAPGTEPSESRAVDPTFEPLERARRAINNGIRRDDLFPELDQLVQRICVIFAALKIG